MRLKNTVAKLEGERLSLGEIKDTCRAMGLTHYDDQTPVLALLGWVYSPDTRRNLHVFWDFFATRVNMRSGPKPKFNHALALGVTRTLARYLD
ncbi:MAG: hypothetical protein AAGK37_02760 [Pseudomonadota bacterium]